MTRKISQHKALRKPAAKMVTTYLTSISGSVTDPNTVAVLEVPPRQQTHISLGKYTATNAPRGFSIEVSPISETAETVETQITTVESPDGCRFVLQLANYGSKTITAKIDKV